jgi:ribosomal protein S27E
MGPLAGAAAGAGAAPGAHARQARPARGAADSGCGALAIAPRAHDHEAMANPIALSIALSRLVAITCPYCRNKKLVSREPKQFRICPRCHKRFTDPRRRK